MTRIPSSVARENKKTAAIVCLGRGWGIPCILPAGAPMINLIARRPSGHTKRAADEGAGGGESLWGWVCEWMGWTKELRNKGRKGVKGKGLQRL